MKIPKFFHPILGILVASILFLLGVAVLSITFVAVIRCWEYAMPYVLEAVAAIGNMIKGLT